MLRVCTAKWLLLRPDLSRLKRTLRRRDKGSQSKCRPKAKIVKTERIKLDGGLGRVKREVSDADGYKPGKISPTVSRRASERGHIGRSPRDM